MGFFGFGKKRKSDDVVEESIEPIEVVDKESDASSDSNDLGPWDINDPGAPNWDEYLNMGALYLPFLPGIELRIKAAQEDGSVISATITYMSSSLEVEAFAAPKSMGIWDEIREEFLEARSKAYAIEGTFGSEIILPVQVNGKTVNSRIVGVDGPRWMVRAIFTGPAAEETQSDEKKALDQFLSDIVVNRGDEPLAPRDRIPLSQPMTPSQVRALARSQAEAASDDGDADEGPANLELPDDPNGYGQEHQVEHTLRRGPMFSEMR